MKWSPAVFKVFVLFFSPWAWCFIVLPQFFWCDFAFPSLAQVTFGPHPQLQYTIPNPIHHQVLLFNLLNRFLIHHLSPYSLPSKASDPISLLNFCNNFKISHIHPFPSISNAHNAARRFFLECKFADATSIFKLSISLRKKV